MDEYHCVDSDCLGSTSCHCWQALYDRYLAILFLPYLSLGVALWIVAGVASLLHMAAYDGRKKQGS